MHPTLSTTALNCVPRYKTTSAAQDINWTKTTAPVELPSLFEYANGASDTPSKLPGQTDIRSGGPGSTSLVRGHTHTLPTCCCCTRNFREKTEWH